MTGVCANPVCSRPARRAGRCNACYMWKRRHKSERSEEAIVANGYRQMVRELERVSVTRVVTSL